MGTIKKITPLQCRDTCLALTFLLLLIWFFTRNAYLVYAAMLLLLIGMVVPIAMQPLAWAWFGLSHLLGQVMSRLLFGIVYLLLVLPVGLIRRLLGKDALRLRLWKQNTASCFVERTHVFSAEDLKNPY
ncbi:MAG: SxtJ family membrane protein [Deltaproteobacteria bacterium]|jgi:hypothetical protein|nr:SxtJ family membrane protein [Deltaproteobacteria bacterium]